MAAKSTPRSASPRRRDMRRDSMPVDRRGRKEESPAMTGPAEPRADRGFRFYGPQYARFESGLAARMRREVYGEDIGQQGWRTAAEQAEIADLVLAGPDRRVLDVGCGSGGPSLALVARSGCRLTGLDAEAAGIAHAEHQASARGFADRATFAVLDCGGRLPFEDCILRCRPLHRRGLPSSGSPGHLARVGPPSPEGRPPPVHGPRRPDRRRREERAGGPRIGRLLPRGSARAQRRGHRRRRSRPCCAPRTARRRRPRSPPAGMPCGSARPTC